MFSREGGGGAVSEISSLAERADAVRVGLRLRGFGRQLATARQAQRVETLVEERCLVPDAEREREGVDEGARVVTARK